MKNKKTVSGAGLKTSARLNDGKQDGTIIAVSGDDVAIRWDCGTVEQCKVSEMTRYHPGVKAPQRPS